MENRFHRLRHQRKAAGSPTTPAEINQPGMAAEIISCEVCGLVQRVEGPTAGQDARCARCESVLREGHSNSRMNTAALSLAALFLYLPANIYPILRMQYVGRYSESTVWDGVVRLFQHGKWFVAVVVFLASIVVPLLKLSGLFFLVWSGGRKSGRRLRTWIYKAICVIGPWAMLDVFLLAVLVALVKLGDFATVKPGPGILAFCGVVVLTLLASSTFDPRLIWQGEKR
jgi:paraquat-inducible protein A